MSNVVRHPRLCLAAGCLMVTASTKLRVLHAAAQLLRIPRSSFYRSASRDGSLPRYSLSPAQLRRAEARLGPMTPAGSIAEDRVLDACFRLRRRRTDTAAAR